MEDRTMVLLQLLYRKINGECKRFVSSLKTGAGERKIPIYCEELENALKEQLNQHLLQSIVKLGVFGFRVLEEI